MLNQPPFKQTLSQIKAQSDEHLYSEEQIKDKIEDKTVEDRSKKVEIKEDRETKINVEGGETIKSKYSIEYLKKMINGSKITDDMTIKFNKDYPLKLEYTLLIYL